MGEVLAASDVCLATLMNIPLFATTYPNKIFDYMAAGRPTILAIDGVIRDVVEKADGGIFVPPGDDARLADAVLALHRDQSRSRAMGASARDYVCKHFNRHEQAREFVALIERVGVRR
jgi:glycosyltransferase involved in cell wall biosynthesis